MIRWKTAGLPVGFRQQDIAMKRQKTKPKNNYLSTYLPYLSYLPTYLYTPAIQKKIIFLAVFNQMDELTRESNRPDKSQTFKCFTLPGFPNL